MTFPHLNLGEEEDDDTDIPTVSPPEGEFATEAKIQQFHCFFRPGWSPPFRWKTGCISCQQPDLKDGPYHPLETIFDSRQVVCLDLLGPIAGINSSRLTTLEGYSCFLSARPLKSKKPQRVITDRRSKFTSKEAQAAFAQFGILVEYTQAAKHHLNLVEGAHRSLWDIIRAIRIQKLSVCPGRSRILL